MPHQGHPPPTFPPCCFSQKSWLQKRSKCWIHDFGASNQCSLGIDELCSGMFGVFHIKFTKQSPSSWYFCCKMWKIYCLFVYLPGFVWKCKFSHGITPLAPCIATEPHSIFPAATSECSSKLSNTKHHETNQRLSQVRSRKASGDSFDPFYQSRPHMLRRLGLPGATFGALGAVLRPSSSATCRSCIEMNLRMSTRSCAHTVPPGTWKQWGQVSRTEV